MACLTRLSMIRDRLPSLQDLAVAVRLLRVLTCNNQTKRVSKEQIVDLWKDLRRLFAGGATPSFRRLQEALAKDAKKPTDDWIDWFRELAISQDIDALEVGAIAGAFDAEMDNARQVIVELPPRFRKALGPEFDLRQQPWAVRVRLRSGITRESVDAAVQREIDIAGGLKHFVRKCNRWWEIKPLLDCSEWVIDWPNANDLERRIQAELAVCEKRGDDLSITLDDVMAAILSILEEHSLAWRKDDSSSINIMRKKLEAGIIRLPGQITPFGVRSAVQLAFDGHEVESRLVETAIEKLFDRRIIRPETVTHIPSGSEMPVPQIIYCVVQHAGEDALEIPYIPPLEIGTAAWLRNTVAAELAGLSIRSLARYRRAPLARWIAKDVMSGIDRHGRKWRRQGTKNSHPYYLSSSLKHNTHQ